MLLLINSHNTAQWARNSLREDGLIRDDTPRSVWEFSRYTIRTAQNIGRGDPNHGPPLPIIGREDMNTGQAFPRLGRGVPDQGKGTPQAWYARALIWGTSPHCWASGALFRGRFA